MSTTTPGTTSLSRFFRPSSRTSVRSPVSSPVSPPPSVSTFHRSLSQTALDISPNLLSPFLPPPNSASSSRDALASPNKSKSFSTLLDMGLRVDQRSVEASLLGGEEEWRKICTKVIKVFSKKQLAPVEHVTELVRYLFSTDLRQNIFERGHSAVISDLFRLLADGLLYCRAEILPSALSNEESHRIFVSQLLQQWKYYKSSIMPYVEAVMLPLRIDAKGANRVDLKIVLLASFRDQVVLPFGERLRGKCFLTTALSSVQMPCYTFHS